VRRVIVENGRARGVEVGSGRSVRRVEADVVVLAAGGIGDPPILRASGLDFRDRLWVDIVLTIGGASTNARMLDEPPMVWFAQRDQYILSPYIDLLTHFFHRPWRGVSIEDRVGLMIKLADTEEGTVEANGSVAKGLSDEDRERLDEARVIAHQVMEGAGVKGPFVDGMFNAGHLGGTLPLSREDVPTMRPGWLPEGLWVADLSLLPRSQGLPTMLTAAALGLRVARRILEGSGKGP
jgi:choline dehydrogenase-like flavoprotein